MDFQALIEAAAAVINFQQYTKHAEGGGVAAGILTDQNNIYTGICFETACSLGFCAEHSAVAEMLKAGETRIVKCVAIKRGNRILPPCGRCRELLSQLHEDNYLAEILLPDNQVKTLAELLPNDWKKY